MTTLLQVTTTTDSREAAEHLGRTLVEERLAACAQVDGPITSVYRWQARVESAAEWYCHLKTTAARFPDLESRIRALHSYETPEVIAVALPFCSQAYATWVEDAVATPPS